MRVSIPFPRTRDRSSVPSSKKSGPLWMLIPVILIATAGIAVWRLRTTTTTTTTTTATVSQGTLTVSVSGSGSVAAARTVDVPFQQAGTVTSVGVKVGDQVKAGQTLAQIDAGALQLQLEQAQAALKAAQAKLAQTKGGGATPQDLSSAQAALDSARAQLQQTRTGTATAADIQGAQAQVTAAQAKLNALKNPAQADLNTAQNKVDQAQISLQSTRDSSSQTKTNAQLALQNAANALTQAQSKYAIALSDWQHVQSTGTDPNQPTTTNAQGKKVANKVTNAQRQSYYDTYVQAQAALNSAQNDVTQAQVAYDTARQKEVSDVQQAESTLTDAQQQLDALKNPSTNDVIQAQAAVTEAQANLNKLRQGGTAAQIAQSQAAVIEAQANLDKLTAPAADADIAAADASVLQSQADVDTAQRNLDEATLKAPFDGVVSAVNVQAGGLVGTSTAAVTIVDRSKLHIDVNLSETDVAKVQVGQPVQLTFDALPNVTLNGTVTTVAPTATVSQNVVTYPVQVEFDPGNTAVKVGMSATANIQVQKIDNAILVPSRAVQTSGNTKTVTVLQGTQRTPVMVQVQTGATSNGQTVITGCTDTGSQCLRAGDVLSIPSTTTSSASSSQNRNNGLGGLGGLGGPSAGGPRGG